MASLYESLGEKVETGEIKVEWRNEWVHLGMEKNENETSVLPFFLLVPLLLMSVLSCQPFPLRYWC